MLNIFKTQEKTKDPVCGMSVDKEKTQFSSKMNEKVYYFCSQNCKQQFDTQPEKYATKSMQNKSGCCQDNNLANKSNKPCC